MRALPPTPRALDPALIVALLVLAGYFGVARIVGNFYPFSTFPMYAQEHTSTATRIAARDVRGAVREVTDFATWDCPAPLDPDDARCGGSGQLYTIRYIDREAADYIASHHGDAAHAPVTEIVRHVWHFADDTDATRVDDCVMLTCRAVPR